MLFRFNQNQFTEYTYIISQEGEVRPLPLTRDLTLTPKILKCNFTIIKVNQ